MTGDSSLSGMRESTITRHSATTQRALSTTSVHERRPHCHDCDDDPVVKIVVGECIPDGAGGCKRSRGLSTSGTGCCAGAPQGDNFVDGVPIEDACCAPASIKDDDGCCSDCGHPESSDADSCKDECCAITEVKVNADKGEDEDACCSACDSPQPEADVNSCKDDCCAGLVVDDCCAPSGVVDVSASVGCCSGCGPGSEDDAASCKDSCYAKGSGSTADEKDDCCSECAPSDADPCKDSCCDGKDPTHVNSKACCGDAVVLAPPSVDCCGGGSSEPEKKAACQSRCCESKVEDASVPLKRPQAIAQPNDAVPAQSNTPAIRHRHLRVVTRAAAASSTEKSARDPSTSAHVRPRRHHHHKRTGSSSGPSNCSMETTFGRFFEAACCCLVDWGKAGLAARRGTRKHHHHKPTHKHKDSNETRRKSSVKTTPVGLASGSKKTSKNMSSTSVYPADLSDTELGAKDVRPLVLSVHGMDCPSCASKLTRALLTLPSVANVKVNMFTDQATLTYAEGLVLPEVIAKRAGDMTGFKCAVLEEANISQEGSMKTMRIGIPNTSSTSASWDVGMDLDAEKLDLPKGTRVHSIKQSSSISQGQIILEVEYDGSVIQPRAVLAAFEPWDGTFLPTPKPAPGLQASLELRSLFYRTLLSAIFCIPVLVFSWAPLPPAHTTVYGAMSLALTTLIQTLIAYPLYSSALRSLFFQHLIDMDLLVVLSSTIAYVFSTVAFFLRVAGDDSFSTPFFETPAMLVTLIMLGRLVSAFARRRATQALDGIRAMQTDTVELVQQRFGGPTVTISSELVHLGDILRVAPDSLVPTDGTVMRGASQVDESSVTGESMPVEKAAGAKLTAGTLNLSGELYMRVARLPADNTVSDIGKLMLQVQESRLPVQDLADRAASYLAPTILALGVLTFVVWLAVGLRVRNQSGQDAAVGALKYAVAVLVVSCPCALVLCVPMVAVISAAVAAKEGVLFKSVQAVQYAKNVDAVVFDKTGTLTTGQLAVAESRVLDTASLGCVLGLVSGSHHPVAEAVAKHIRSTYPDVKDSPLKDLKSVPGRGMEARNGKTYVRGGNIAWLNLASNDVLKDMLNASQKPLTFFAVMTSDAADFAAANLVAVFGLTDTIRPSARDTMQLLGQQGVDVHIVSGDELSVVKALASELHVSDSHALGRCLPQGKLDYVRSLQAGDNAHKTVMFVGDGTNDGLALAQADIGVSLSAGTDIALSAADVVILDSDAADLARSLRVVLEISTGAVRRIVLNFAWALVYNVFAVLLAAGAFVRVRIAPEYAGLGEMVSVVPVVLVAWSMWLLKR
ncbi:heavy metal translocatin [Dentipellis sp. KUC8613]|nr:heavy metal translocatin [Dentipellis sp. KUC8613]